MNILGKNHLEKPGRIFCFPESNFILCALVIGQAIVANNIKEEKPRRQTNNDRNAKPNQELFYIKNSEQLKGSGSTKSIGCIRKDY